MARLRLDSLSARNASAINPPYCPDIGDVIWISFDPQAGREQAGRRRALVLTPRNYNQLVRLCVLCPITSQGKGYPFEVEASCGGSTIGVVLSDHVKSLSWEERRAELIETSDPEVIANVRAKLKALLAIP